MIDPGRSRGPQDEFLSAFELVRKPLLLGHVTPDADCLGSCLGLAGAMREQGLDARIGLPPDCVPDRLAFMLELDPTIPVDRHVTPDSDRDALLFLDTATEKRINLGTTIVLPTQAVRFSLDHHITNTDFATHNWVDPHASSTCEMIARLILELGWRISPHVASLLYAGIHGDTGGFSLPPTTAESLQIAADLVRAGADVTHIGEQLCRSQGRRDFELLRRVYDHTTVVADGLIAYSYLTYHDISESGCRPEDIDDQVSIPRALRGVRIAMLFSEGEPGVVRINLRGEGRTTVVELAQRFGGGGHPQSAGVRMKNKPIQDVITMIVAAAEEHLKSH
ncbi:MAG: bifunctional oligoribonuclease/PAP phosphatase NrnA [Planctomycetota bacterium]